jgi:hypothetical protein
MPHFPVICRQKIEFDHTTQDYRGTLVSTLSSRGRECVRAAMFWRTPDQIADRTVLPEPSGCSETLKTCIFAYVRNVPVLKSVDTKIM